MKYVYTKIHNNHLIKNDISGIAVVAQIVISEKMQSGLGMTYGRSGSGGKRDARSEPGMTYLV